MIVVASALVPSSPAVGHTPGGAAKVRRLNEFERKAGRYVYQVLVPTSILSLLLVVVFANTSLYGVLSRAS